MKVLGVGDDKFICEVSWDEMYHVTGSGGEYDEEMPAAGDEVDLSRVIKAARWIRDLDNNHIDSIINGMRTMLVGMEKVKDTAGALTLFNKIKNVGTDDD